MHEWIYENLRLPEKDARMIQIDGLERRVFIKKHHRAGTIESPGYKSPTGIST